MWCCWSATMVRPLASNRARMVPTSPRRTASGLSRTRVRCDEPSDMAHTLVRGSGRPVARLPRSPLDLDLAAEGPRRGPQGEEHGPEHEHRGHLEAHRDGSDLDRP